MGTNRRSGPENPVGHGLWRPPSSRVDSTTNVPHLLAEAKPLRRIQPSRPFMGRRVGARVLTVSQRRFGPGRMRLQTVGDGPCGGSRSPWPGCRIVIGSLVFFPPGGRCRPRGSGPTAVCRAVVTGAVPAAGRDVPHRGWPRWGREPGRAIGASAGTGRQTPPKTGGSDGRPPGLTDCHLPGTGGAGGGRVLWRWLGRDRSGRRWYPSPVCAPGGVGWSHDRSGSTGRSRCSPCWYWPWRGRAWRSWPSGSPRAWRP